MTTILNAHKYCKQKASQSGSSFYYSFLFLPPKQQQAIIAVYAFCREVDDIVDNATNQVIAAKKIAFWENEISKIYFGIPAHPIALALADALNYFTLPQQYFMEILQGMYMDLQYQGYSTFADLKLYCYRVASTVGMLAATIFGFNDPQTLVYARKLGIALQLVNIIRDVKEDLQRDRVYLPEEDLAKFNLTVTEMLTAKCERQDNFIALMRYQGQRARDYYQQALNNLVTQDRPQQISGLIMARIYFAVLDKIEANNFKVLTKRISLTPLSKIWLVWQTIKQEKRQEKITI